MTKKQQPLEGIRVIDLTSVISGPFCTMMLADQGADVIKVERPGIGDLTRHLMTSRNGVSALFINLNRNKRSIALDLNTEAAKQALTKLVAGADVLVENFRPGTMERLGLGYDQIKKVNPALIYVSINGFGSDGPCAGDPAYDPLLQARCGIVDQQRHPETGDVDVMRNSVFDKVASLTAMQAVTAALFDRERGGDGRHIEVAMLDATLSFYWPDGMMNHTFLGDGVDRHRPISEATRVYHTRDGHMLISAAQQKDIEGLCRALNCTELLAKPEFKDTYQRVANYPQWEAAIMEKLEYWDGEVISGRLKNEGVPHAIVNRASDVLEDEQVKARQIIQEQQHPRGGDVLQTRPPAIIDGVRTSVRARSAPDLGQHSEEILREAGLKDEEIKRLVSSDAN